MRNEEGYELKYSQFTWDALAEDMGCPPDKVKEFIDYCAGEEVGLFQKNETHFKSQRLSRDMQALDIVREMRKEAGIRSAQSRLKDNTIPTSARQLSSKRSTIRVEKSIVDIIPDYLEKELWESFLEMRKKKRAIPTDKAKELLLAELEKLRLAGSDPNEVLKQSIMKNWTGLFPLKEGYETTRRSYEAVNLKASVGKPLR